MRPKQIGKVRKITCRLRKPSRIKNRPEINGPARGMSRPKALVLDPLCNLDDPDAEIVEQSLDERERRG